MKKILLTTLLVPAMALAQTFPSPTFNSLTLQNPLTPTNGGTGATSSTGAGSVVLSNSPALTTPNLGTPSAVTLTHGTGLPISTGVSGLGTGVATGLANAVTGSGSPVLATSPALTTPNLGTPSAVTLTNGTGLPVSTGISGLGTGVSAALANAATGSGGPALSGSPTFTGTITNNSAGSALTVGGSTPVNGNASTFFYPTYFGNPGTGVNAKFNRMQIGTEALSTTDLISGNQQTTQSWVQTYAPSLMSTASIAVTSQIGTSAIGAAARSSDFRTWAGSESGGAGGIYGVGVNDDTTPATSPIAGGVFGVAARLSGVNGITLNQFDVSNYGSVVDAFPNTSVTSGSTFALAATPGAYATVNNATAAMYVGGGFSTSKFRKGLIFFNNSLDTSVGSGGAGVAIEMGLGQSIRWLNNSNATLAEMFGNSSGLAIVDNTTISGASTGAALTLSATTNTINGASILLTGNGATTPSKTLEVVGGQFQIQNNAGTGTVLSVTDAGNTFINGSLTTNGNDALLYSNTSGQSFTSGTAATVTGWTKTFDRVNSNFNASTGVFTAPATGYYQVSGMLTFASALQAVNTAYQASIIINGVTSVAVATFRTQAAQTFSPTVVIPGTVVSLTAGQTVTIQGFQNSGSAQTLNTGAGLNVLSINRIP